MTITSLVLSITLMLLLALVARPVAAFLRVPFGGLLVIIGFVVSELVVGMGYDTGLRWQNFRELILYVLLPVLVFNSALQTDVASLKKFWTSVLSLSIPLMVVATLLCGVLLFYLMGHPGGFPWVAAMLAAALFVATDPLAVTEILMRYKIPPPVTTLVEGEGMFGDAMAIALYTSLVAYALTMDQGTTQLVGNATLIFVWAVVGGIGIGLASGWLLYKTLWNKLWGVERGILSLVYVYLVYLINELWLQTSGVVALLAAGLILGQEYRRHLHDQDTEFVAVLWRFLSEIAYAVVFLLVGATITVDMFRERWLAMIIAIAALLAARLPVVYMTLPIQNRLLKQSGLNAMELSIVYFGGVRGAVTLALALSLPVELPYWWTIQSMAYGVVLFSLFVQSPIVEILVRKYRASL